MYKHQNACLVPRPDFGRRIDLSMYRDPDCLVQTPTSTPAPATAASAPPQPHIPVSEPQAPPAPPPCPSSPSASLPPSTPSTELLVLPLTQPSAAAGVPQSQNVIEITTTTTVTTTAANGAEETAVTMLTTAGQCQCRRDACTCMPSYTCNVTELECEDSYHRKIESAFKNNSKIKVIYSFFDILILDYKADCLLNFENEFWNNI